MPISSTTNSGPCVGSVPSVAASRFFAASEPAIASTGTITPKRPNHIASASMTLWNGVSADRPAKALPLLLAAEDSAYSTSENPCGPGFRMPARPACDTTATAVPASTSSGVTRIATETIFISQASIFLPRYSGVRPIIRPAMTTAMMANTSIPYRPEPTPPNTTSPRSISTSGTAPPSGVNESCVAFTAPQLAAVVIVAKSVDALMPKRASLPSMLPPGWVALAAWSTPSAASAGLPCCSNTVAGTAKATNSSVIVASTAHPWRRSPTMRPKTKHSAAGIAKMASISSRSVTALGFSYGCAELALKKPPPFVPSILIASCEATGPIARVWVGLDLSSITGRPWASSTGWPSAPSRACCQ